MLQKDYVIADHNEINSALKKINSNKYKTLLVLNKYKHLVGTISDGDIRRGILKYNSLKIKINKIYNKKVISFKKQSDLKKKDEIFFKKEIDLIPYLEKKKIKKIYFNIKNLQKNTIKYEKLVKISSVIIAGGLGKRLEPYNKIFPKPLMPYKNSSLLREIIRRFENYHINNFTIITNYKSDDIKKYLSTLKSKAKIKIIKEKSRLGTSGGLAYLKKQKISNNFFVINCDTILNVNFQKIYDFHIKKKSLLTIVACKKKIKVPFGNCLVNDNLKLKQISEKPKLQFLANTGCYIFNKKILKYIEKDKFLDFNDLVSKLLKRKIDVFVYNVAEEQWSDFGTLTSFKLQ